MTGPSMDSRRATPVAITACALAGALALLGGATAGQGQQAPRDLAPYFTPAAATPAKPDADGFLRRWLLLEPIPKPNRSNTVFTASYVRDALNQPSFATDIPRDGQVVQGTPPLRWHALDSATFDVKLFDFAQRLGKPTYGVIFRAVTIVDAPREMRNVRLAVGSNAASLWWLDGREVAGLFNDRRMVMDDVLSDRLTLHKGRNVLRGAVINGPGLSAFCVRFVDEAGRPVTDLTIAVR